MRTHRYLTVFAITFLGACASSDTTSPTVDVNALVDQTGVAGYAAASLSASVPGVTATVPTSSTGASSCVYSSANQRFECAPVTVNGVTITRSYALLDASGHALSTPNPTAIASIHSITDIKGTMSGTATSAASMTIDRHEDATMSELQAATHVLNGTATQTLSFAASGSSYGSNETSTTANLKIPKPTAASHWPLGGTITTDRIISVGGTAAAIASHEVLAFDGTSVMTLTRTSGGVTMTCKIDLAKPAVMPVCS
jgi:hypothetical protein